MLLFIDSCGDHFNNISDIRSKWDISNSDTSQYRLVSGKTNYGLELNSILGKYLGAEYSSIIVGLAFKINGVVDNYEILGLGNRSPYTTSIKLLSNGSITVLNTNSSSSITRATSQSNIIQPNTWHYLEVKVVTSTNSTGSIQVKVDTTTVISSSSISTVVSNSGINTFYIPGNNYKIVYDDIYVLSTSGSVNNNFLGIQRVYVALPEFVGSNTSWGTNGSLPTVLNSSNYIYSNTTGDITTFNLQDFNSTLSSITGVQLGLGVKKEGSNSISISGYLYSGTGYLNTKQFKVNNNYKVNSMVYDQHPSSTSWTRSNLNAMEFGIKNV